MSHPHAAASLGHCSQATQHLLAVCIGLTLSDFHPTFGQQTEPSSNDRCAVRQAFGNARASLHIKGTSLCIGELIQGRTKPAGITVSRSAQQSIHHTLNVTVALRISENAIPDSTTTVIQHVTGALCCRLEITVSGDQCIQLWLALCGNTSNWRSNICVEVSFCWMLPWNSGVVVQHWSHRLATALLCALGEVINVGVLYKLRCRTDQPANV
mmetsp:Transcript_26550/g.58574  ORF Transcript_26550/g.58574 Transcript_26550/m.58574 type:complete len:212 (+) Transcript_26550:298-933(+)